jgi:hypothetical protein
VDERACPSCGAQNAVTAEYCWQCFTRFAGPAPDARERPARGAILTAALGTGPGAGTPSAALTEPATMTRWQPQHSTRGDRFTGVALKILVGLLAALVAFLGYRWLTRGFELPDEVAGQPRMEGELVESFEDLIEGFGSLGDVEFQIGLYGTLAPAYYLAVAEVPDGQDFVQAYEEFVTGSMTDTGPVDALAVTCTTTVSVGSHCTWADEEQRLVVFLMGYTSTEADLQTLAADLRAELG